MSLGYYVITSRASDRANSLPSPHATHTLDLALPNMILCRKVTECLCRDSNHLCPGTPMLLDSSPVPIVCPRLETNGGATACLYTCLHVALVGTSGVALVGTSGLSWHGTKPRAARLCRFGAARLCRFHWHGTKPRAARLCRFGAARLCRFHQAIRRAFHFLHAAC